MSSPRKARYRRLGMAGAVTVLVAFALLYLRPFVRADLDVGRPVNPYFQLYWFGCLIHSRPYPTLEEAAEPAVLWQYPHYLGRVLIVIGAAGIAWSVVGLTALGKAEP